MMISTIVDGGALNHCVTDGVLDGRGIAVVRKGLMLEG